MGSEQVRYHPHGPLILPTVRPGIPFVHESVELRRSIIQFLRCYTDFAVSCAGGCVQAKAAVTSPCIFDRQHLRPHALAALLLSAFASHALAQPMPVPKQGQCPSGYRESGGYCAPMTDSAPNAIPKSGQCPSGWRQSGSYCIRTSPQRREQR